ncbi:hypothetical protein H4582DRAFT_2058612 [Lactarius indigo]|nr:hypothetical protein H4582DRAFT_2058612 [Lactarius indigo]
MSAYQPQRTYFRHWVFYPSLDPLAACPATHHQLKADPLPGSNLPCQIPFPPTPLFASSDLKSRLPSPHLRARACAYASSPGQVTEYDNHLPEIFAEPPLSLLASIDLPRNLNADGLDDLRRFYKGHMLDARSGFTARTDDSAYNYGSDAIESQVASGCGVSKLVHREEPATAAVESNWDCLRRNLWFDVLAQAFIQPQPRPHPVQDQNGKNSGAHSSEGPATRRSAGLQSCLATPWKRAPSGRPTSELLGSATFQTPEETVYVSEAERTAALCSLLQRSTQVVQIRFFINFLHQIVRADFVTTLLGPAVGGSMQSQMEAKLASMNLNSPGFESTLPGSLHPYLQHQRHELPILPTLSATQATPRPRSRNSAPTAPVLLFAIFSFYCL